jgi:hypothetical protein
MALPVFIFDTSPLITLAGVYVDGLVAVENVLAVIRLLAVETVAQEAAVNPHYPDAVIIQDFLT